MGKGILFHKWCWENRISTCKTVKLDPYLTSYTKIKMDQRLKAKTIKFVREWGKLNDSRSDNGLLGMR